MGRVSAWGRLGRQSRAAAVSALVTVGREGPAQAVAVPVFDPGSAVMLGAEGPRAGGLVRGGEEVGAGERGGCAPGAGHDAP